MTTPWEREQRRARCASPAAWLAFLLLVGGLCAAVAWAYGSHWEDGRKRPGERAAPGAAEPLRQSAAVPIGALSPARNTGVMRRG